ncbi:hypothetical protein NDU88_007381 [Pleurodeles waltl]|uniref:Uncharacterized protein n=1 Tax=Pleurodeles waltl TaxID=8319 RepID=A0AAV7WGW6_PLEWA|nr:hypothetical protein NDU88_007381 [Pleurodeles waltl]
MGVPLCGVLGDWRRRPSVQPPQRALIGCALAAGTAAGRRVMAAAAAGSAAEALADPARGEPGMCGRGALGRRGGL